MMVDYSVYDFTIDVLLQHLRTLNTNQKLIFLRGFIAYDNIVLMYLNKLPLVGKSDSNLVKIITCLKYNPDEVLGQEMHYGIELQKSIIEDHRKILMEYLALYEYQDARKYEEPFHNIIKEFERITWFGPFKQLQELFKLLADENYIVRITDEEIIIHFKCMDEPNIIVDLNKARTHKIIWRNHDCDFCCLVDIITRNKLVYDLNQIKFKQFEPHFVNWSNSSIKDISQKKHQTEIFSSKEKNFQEIINKILLIH